MQLKRCDQGHYFDPTKHSGCPHCGIKIDFDFLPQSPLSGGVDEDQKTVAMNAPPPPSAPPPSAPSAHSAPVQSPMYSSDDRTVAHVPQASPIIPPVQRPVVQGGSAASNDNKTIGIFRKKIGIEPVVGWLVCFDGADRGRDYRIISQRNFIGRSEKMDICISGDETISRDGHAIISYNPKKNSFMLYPGESRGIVYLNDDEVVTASELKPYDIIELGQTKLLFIPFCGEKFQWM